jgi:hypothetical protein
MHSIPTYHEFLNEARTSFNGMNFQFSVINDTRGMSLQFIPDSKTLEKFSKNEQVDTITEKLKKGMPEFTSSLSFQSGSDAAGLVFRIDPYTLADVITKAMK